MGKPQYEKRRNVASDDEDMIPLKDKSKQGKTRNQVILEGLGDLQYSSILYRYGSFQTLNQDGQIWNTQLKGDLYSKTDNFLKNEFPPSFLDELVKIVSFDLIIYRTDNKALFVRIRTFTGIAAYIYQIFIYWLKLNDEDRRLLKVYINIPRDDKKMLHILYVKWEEMLNTSDDPRILTEQIQSLKSSLTEICDPSILHTTTDKISRLRTKLLNLYNSTACQWLDILRQITKAVRKSVRKSKVINDRLYLRCIYTYNEIYLPRTLTKKELHELLNKYYADSKKIDNVKSKKQKKKFDPYAQFLQSLQENNMLAPQKKGEKRTFYTLEQNNDDDSEKNMETIKNINAPGTSSLQQKDTVNLEISASKKKKKKKRKTSESNTDVAKNEVASSDLSVENKAKKVINEALEFNLPYINKAVEEVKKQRNDKNIKQEHIDVLQRLINLETDHQQYVSSFCSHLK